MSSGETSLVSETNSSPTWTASNVSGLKSCTRASLRDAIFLDHRLVEDEAEPGIASDLEHPVLWRWPVRPHRLPDRVALGVGEALRVSAMRDRAEQMPRDLRFLVVSHVHAGRGAQRGGAAPLRDSAAFGGVDVDEVDGACVEQPPHAVARDLALPRGDRDARPLTHARHQGGVVVPVAGLLEPSDVERLDEPRETD